MPSRDVTVTTTEMRVVEPNPRRVTLTIQNKDNANFVDIADKTGGAGGVRIYHNASATWLKKLGDDPTKARYGTADTASCVVCVEEELAGAKVKVTPRPLPSRQSLKTSKSTSRPGSPSTPRAPGAGRTARPT